jgi:hypothetical protein
MKKYNAIKFITGIIILISLCFTGCKNWEYDVDKNGIHFTKISQSESGTVIGFMTEDHDIQGFPCEKGWIHFKNNFQLRLFQLSKDFMYKGTLLPAHTWFLYPYNDVAGYICAFPNDYKVQGYLCQGSGGPKGISTSFYDSGKLRSFYPPEDITLYGIPCEASLLSNVNLHENGKIRSCKLSEDYRVDGKTFKKGRVIELDESGKPK